MPSGGAIFGNRRHGAEKRADLARAIAFRESRRCRHCGALGYVPCAHRDNADDAPKPAPAFPFRDHRTCAEWMGATGARIAAGEGRVSAPVADEIAPHRKAE